MPEFKELSMDPLPPGVVFAALLQFMLAASFLLVAIAARLYGAAAQRAAEAEAVNQGLGAGVLGQHGVRFEERGIELLLPIAIALCLAALTSLNWAGEAVGRTVSWIVQPVVLVGGGIVTAAQVFTVRYLESVFKRSGDAMLERLNVRNVVEAALGAFPRGFYYLVVTRFVLSTVGSVLVVVLLALPSADAHFR
jgi:hypothetical protein